jgi:quinol monooxygenase YgiN
MRFSIAPDGIGRCSDAHAVASLAYNPATSLHGATNMITVVAKLQAVTGKEDQLRAVLTEMVGNVKKHEAGKVPTYSLHTSDADPTLFLFYEQYADAEGLAAHSQTDHMKAMGASLAGLLAGRPVIERYTRIASVS